MYRHSSAVKCNKTFICPWDKTRSCYHFHEPRMMMLRKFTCMLTWSKGQRICDSTVDVPMCHVFSPSQDTFHLVFWWKEIYVLNFSCDPRCIYAFWVQNETKRIRPFFWPEVCFTFRTFNSRSMIINLYMMMQESSMERRSRFSSWREALYRQSSTGKNALTLLFCFSVFL